MKDWLKHFLSEFQRTYLKELGFKKTRHTFSRDMNTYWERFNFQSSQWNGVPGSDWTFYINVGVEYKDLEPPKAFIFLPHTHWADRIEGIVPSAPWRWEYNAETDPRVLMTELLPLIKKASEMLARDIEGLRTHRQANGLVRFPFTQN